MAPEPIQNLIEYCSASGITIQAVVQPKTVPGAGLGVYATKKIKSGEQLVHVPTRHIFTTANIPEHFLSKSARKEIAVHAQLAAFFAFGSEQDLQQYKIWMATWPGVDEFVENMPIFWGYWAEQVLGKLERPAGIEGMTDDHLPKRRRLSERSSNGRGTNQRRIKVNGTDSTSLKQPLFCLSPALTGRWTTTDTLDSSMLGLMIEKLAGHVKSIATALPDLHLIESNQQLAKFLHAWCLVNTRCFYYVPAPASAKHRARAKAPTDPNEAMALCPFMDLFNHMAPPPSPETFGSPARDESTQRPCKVRYTTTGFTVTTDSPILPDHEILFSYGAHTNDALWLEYGFLLPNATNTSDCIPLDALILETLNPLDESTLEDHGYLGSYTLHHDGSICYRTEMVAWLLVLGRAKWAKVVEQGLDPEEACTAPTGKAKYTKTVVAWLERARDLAGQNAELLEQTGDDLLLEQFGTMSAVAGVQRKEREEELGTAKKRKGMCLTRWAQIGGMVEQGIRKVEAETR